MYCWRPCSAHPRILLQICTLMLTNWFPQSKVTRNQGSIFTSFSNDFIWLGSEKHVEWIYVDARGWCDATANSRDAGFYVHVAILLQVNLPNAWPILPHFVPFYKN